MRRYGQPPLPDQYYAHRPGAYGIFFHSDRLLLTQQLYSEIREWQLPGGGIDPGESPISALVREAYEETGWRVFVKNKIGQYRRFVFMPEYGFHAEKICHVYIGRAVYKLGEPTEPHHQAHLVSRGFALNNLANEAERELLAGFNFSSH